MAITYVGSNTATGNTVTLPAHQAGDCIVIFAFRDGSTTAPTLPAGFTNVNNTTTTSTSMRMGYKVAASSSETSGTWTNASAVAVSVYRGGHPTLPAGSQTTGSGTAATVTWPTLNCSDSSGVSWIVGAIGHRSIDTNIQNAPTGLTNRATQVDATCEIAIHDTNGQVTSFTGLTQTIGGTSSGWALSLMEIREPPRAGQWSISDKATNIVLSNSNTTATKSGTTTGSVRSSTSYSTGKRYFSLTTASTTDVDYGVGVANSTQGLTTLFGGPNSISYTSDGKVWYNNATIATIASYQGAVTVIDVAVDFDNDLIWFRKSGGNWNNSGTANPTTGVGGFSFQSGAGFAAWQCTSATGGNATVDLTPPFTNAAPSGFLGWDVPNNSLSANGLTTGSPVIQNSFFVESSNAADYTLDTTRNGDGVANPYLLYSTGDTEAYVADAADVASRITSVLPRYSRLSGKRMASINVVALNTSEVFASVGLTTGRTAIGASPVSAGPGTSGLSLMADGTLLDSSGNFVASVGSYAANSVIDIIVDYDNDLGFFRVDGGDWNGNGLASPSTGDLGIDLSAYFSPSDTIYPYAALYALNDDFAFNLGAGTFTYPLPAGVGSYDGSQTGASFDWSTAGDMSVNWSGVEATYLDADTVVFNGGVASQWLVSGPAAAGTTWGISFTIAGSPGGNLTFTVWDEVNYGITSLATEVINAAGFYSYQVTIPAPATQMALFFDGSFSSNTTIDITGLTVTQETLWTPANLGTGPNLWFDAQDAATLTLSGSSVSAWANKGTDSSANAVQATGSQRPVYSATSFPGSLPGLTFDKSATQRLEAPFVYTGTDATMFVAFHVPSSAWGDIAFGLHAPSEDLGSNKALFANCRGQDATYYFVEGTRGWAGTGGLSRYVGGTLGEMIALRADGTSTLGWINGNAAPDPIAYVEPLATTIASIGHRGSGTDGINGVVSEVLAFKRALTTTERQLVEGYLAHRWGLTDNLPSGHPYKSAAPVVTAGPPTDALTASNLATGSPVLGSPALGVIRNLTATPLTTSSPVLGSNALGVIRNLTATALATAPPAIATPSMGVVRNLTATAFAASSPVLGSPAFGQAHALAATTLATSSPQLGSPGLVAQAGVYPLTANGLTTAGPVLGSPAVGQVHGLIAQAITTSSPTLGSPAVAQTHPLTATGLATGAAVIGSPALAQVHTLSGVSLATGAASLGNPAIGQKHGLSASNLTTGSPVLAAAALTQAHSLSGTALATGSPVLGVPGLTQSHSLVASGLATGAAVLGSPFLGVVGQMAAAPLTTGSPVIGSPALGQLHALTASGLATGSPAIGTPALVRVVGFTATALTTSSPVIGVPGLGQTHGVATSGLTTGSPVIGVPAFGQGHTLTATALATGSPVFGTPGMSGTIGLTANGLATGAPVLGSPALGQTHTLTPFWTIAGVPDIGSPSLGQQHGLTANGLSTGSPVLGSPGTNQTVTVTATSLIVGVPVFGAPALGQNHWLLANDNVTGGPTFGLPEMGQTHALTGAALAPERPELGNPDIAQTHALTGADLVTTAPELGLPELVERLGVTLYPLGMETSSPVFGLPAITVFQRRLPTAKRGTAAASPSRPVQGEVSRPSSTSGDRPSSTQETRRGTFSGGSTRRRSG